jgi:hypothetical protein
VHAVLDQPLPKTTTSEAGVVAESSPTVINNVVIWARRIMALILAALHPPSVFGVHGIDYLLGQSIPQFNRQISEVEIAHGRKAPVTKIPG